MAPKASNPTSSSYSAEEAIPSNPLPVLRQRPLRDGFPSSRFYSGPSRSSSDAGCGPGNATRDVALSFEQAVWCDPGGQMIEAASGLEL